MKGEINTAKVNKEKIIIMGDFNFKVGIKLVGNKEEITRGGKILLKMVEEEQMTVLNARESAKEDGKENKQLQIYNRSRFDKRRGQRVCKVDND